MSELQPASDSLPAPISRSPWVDSTIAVLVGVGYGLALFNSPATWLAAVVLLVVAVVLYGAIVIRFVRRDQRTPDPIAQRNHGIRLIVLFALAYVFTRVDPGDHRLLFALGCGLLIGAGGFVVLRLEERARLSPRPDKIEP